MLSEARKSKLSEFAESIGFEFEDFELLSVALTHPSYTFENGIAREYCYERLEFLGDSVLKIIVSRYLYDKFESYAEGELSRLRSFLVSDNFIEKLGRSLSIGKYVLVGKNEKKQGGLDRSSTLACAFEAVLGAIYLGGQFHKLYDFLTSLYDRFIDEIELNITSYNAKAMLQEYTQSKSRDLPEYVTLKEEGLDHEKVFEVAVKYKGELLGVGSSTTKKDAQQKAAMEACIKLGVIKDA